MWADIISSAATLLFIGIILRWHHSQIQARATIEYVNDIKADLKADCVSNREGCQRSMEKELGHGDGRFERLEASFKNTNKDLKALTDTVGRMAVTLGKVQVQVDYVARSNGYTHKEGEG